MERRMHILGMLVFIEFFLLITVTRGFFNSRRRATEWDVGVKLIFPYPCENTEVTLQFRRRVPFFSSLNPDPLNLHRDQMGRFAVNIVQERGTCFLELVISPVMRNDQGTYILRSTLAYIKHVKRIWLRVDYPPGKAHCEWDGKPYVGNWVKLICKAEIGRNQGQIQCFQGGMEMPSLQKMPFEYDDTLTKTFHVMKTHDLVERSYPVFCCSAYLTQPKEFCICNDYEWDPKSNIGLSENVNPCPLVTVSPSGQPNVVTPQVKQSTANIPIFSPTSRDSSLHEGVDHHKNVTIVVIFMILKSIAGLLLITAIGLFICWYRRRIFGQEDIHTKKLYSHLFLISLGELTRDLLSVLKKLIIFQQK